MLEAVKSPVPVMKHILKKFTSSGLMFRDPLLGTETTAKACLIEPPHFMLTSLDRDSPCEKIMCSCSLEAFARETLAENLDII